MPRARDRDRRRRRARRRAARSTPARPTRRSRSRATSTPRSTSARRRESGADAIHPGYGFLAENARLRRGGRGRGADLGRPVRPRRSGSAATSSRRSGSRARRAFPVLPDGEPDEIGFPLLVKAAAGGGGRGMRVVREPSRARRGARGRRARGRGGVRRRHALLRALPRAAAPRRGPAPRRRARHRARARRARLLRAAAPPEGARGVALARARPASCAQTMQRRPRSRSRRAIGYASAGTVEFVLDGGEFFFLELNGRIQVEHPVTEAVTGLDLVAEPDPHRRGRARLSVTDCYKVEGTRSRCGSTPRIRGRSCPQAGTHRAAPAARRERPRRRRRRGGRRGRRSPTTR